MLPGRRLVAWEETLGSVFLLATPSVGPSLSRATGMFEYSGQEVPLVLRVALLVAPPSTPGMKRERSKTLPRALKCWAGVTANTR